MSLKGLYINTIHQILKVWWFIARPEGRGAKVILTFGDEILMVQHSYGHRLWTFPGGGVKSNEESVVAAIREMKEELGIDISGLRNIGSYFTDYEHKKITVDCFVTELDTKQVYSDNFEIAQVGWFLLSKLPKNRASSVDKIIKLYEKGI